MGSKAFEGNVVDRKVTSGGSEMCRKVLQSDVWNRKDLNKNVASGSLNL